MPVNSPIFTSVTLSNTNPSGTLLHRRDQPRQVRRDIASITVTATDPTDVLEDHGQ